MERDGKLNKVGRGDGEWGRIVRRGEVLVWGEGKEEEE